MQFMKSMITGELSDDQIIGASMSTPMITAAPLNTPKQP